jgi:hypothetical protein
MGKVLNLWKGVYAESKKDPSMKELLVTVRK